MQGIAELRGALSTRSCPRYSPAIKEPQEQQEVPRVSLGTGQCWKAAGCFRVPEQPAGPFLCLSWGHSLPIHRGGCGGSVGAVAHHSLVWPRVQKGAGLGTQGSPGTESSGRSFGRSCDLRQLCLLWVLPTSTPRLWVLGSPRAPAQPWRCQTGERLGCSNVFSTQPQLRGQVRFWDLRRTQREW